MELSRKMTRRINRDDKIMKEFVNGLRNSKRPRLIMRRAFFMLELKSLFIGKFVQIIDYVFYCIAYSYVLIKFYGNMKTARLNPDVNTMLK